MTGPEGTVPLHVAVWLAAAELNSLWMEAVRLKSDPECVACHHCPTCCSACAALGYLMKNVDMNAAIREHVGTGWPWQDAAGAVDWRKLTKPWNSPCPEA